MASVRQPARETESGFHDYANTCHPSSATTTTHFGHTQTPTTQTLRQQEESGCEGGQFNYFNQQQEGEEGPYVVKFDRLPEKVSRPETVAETQQEPRICSDSERDPQKTRNHLRCHTLLSEEEECSYTIGANLRCNCAGTRRTTLAGLIELFEQGAPIESTVKNTSHTEESQRERGQSYQSRPFSRTVLFRKESRRGRNLKKNRLRDRISDKEQMRGIITPVRYEPNDEDEDNEEEESDSLEYIAEPHGGGILNEINPSQVHRIAVKGVPVLPTTKRSQLRGKLTATNWQPPTDARKYDNLRVRSSSRGSSTRGCRGQAVCFSDDEEEHTAYCNQGSNQDQGGETEKPLEFIDGYLEDEPPVVKHVQSSSRRLLKQLARLRRLSEPAYRVKRPEKAEQVEALIEQLERATMASDDEEGEEFLVENNYQPEVYSRRCLPSESFAPNTPGRSVGEPSIHAPVAHSHRSDIHPFEEDTIAKSHHSALAGWSGYHTLPPACSRRTTDIDPTMNELPQDARSATLDRRTRRRGPWPDRYLDDLAVRRLGTRSSVSTNRAPLESQISYLLCSSAYTPPMHSSSENCCSGSENPLEKWRHRTDDDIGPRSSARERLASGTSPCATLPTTNGRARYDCARASSADSRRLRPESKVSFRDEPKSGFASADSGFLMESSSASRPLSATSRLTSSSAHVEQTATTSRQSARSRLASSSSSGQRCQSALTQADTYDQYLEDSAAEEVDLADELQVDPTAEALAKEWLQVDHCDSPTIERYPVQYSATAARRRSRIKIENPRSKSPLVRVSKNPPPQEPPSIKPKASQETFQMRSYAEARREYSKRATSELQCEYQFTDEDDDGDDDQKMIKVVEKRRTYITTSPKVSNEKLSTDGPTRDYGNGMDQNKLSSGAKQTDTRKKGPLFTIGQYKPLNRPQLKIL